jgi:hypothetical protein
MVTRTYTLHAIYNTILYIIKSSIFHHLTQSIYKYMKYKLFIVIHNSSCRETCISQKQNYVYLKVWIRVYILYLRRAFRTCWSLNVVIISFWIDECCRPFVAIDCDADCVVPDLWNFSGIYTCTSWFVLQGTRGRE